MIENRKEKLFLGGFIECIEFELFYLKFFIYKLLDFVARHVSAIVKEGPQFDTKGTKMEVFH